MPTLDPRLKDLYLNKDECVIDLPEWVLSSNSAVAIGYEACHRGAGV